TKSFVGSSSTFLWQRYSRLIASPSHEKSATIDSHTSGQFLSATSGGEPQCQAVISLFSATANPVQDQLLWPWLIIINATGSPTRCKELGIELSQRFVQRGGFAWILARIERTLELLQHH